MKTLIRPGASLVAVAAALVALVINVRADAPHVYAIKGARLVTAAGAQVVVSGTIVIRNGLIDAIGAGVQPPPDAMVMDGAGLTVYPGLIDMGNTAGLDVNPNQPQPPNLRTTDEAERWKRNLIFRPEFQAVEHLKGDAPELLRLASNGITTVLATPPGLLVKGRSGLVNVVGPADEPQIGSVGDYRRGLQIVRAPVALHIDFTEFPGIVRGDGYPVSLLGAIAFVRQSFLDARYQHAARERFEKGRTDPSLDALQPALEGTLPVAFEAGSAREILRALSMAKELKLDPVITGGREADQAVADLKARNARVIYSLNFPVRSRMLPADADEPVSALRSRAQAPRVPAVLQKAGVLFAFSTAGLRDPKDFVRNAARAVKDGLPADAALRALTIDAARIAGASDRLGSLEKGKLANILVTDADLFDDKMKITHVFVDGRMVVVEDAATPAPRGRSGQ